MLILSQLILNDEPISYVCTCASVCAQNMFVYMHVKVVVVDMNICVWAVDYFRRFWLSIYPRIWFSCHVWMLAGWDKQAYLNEIVCVTASSIQRAGGRVLMCAYVRECVPICVRLNVCVYNVCTFMRICMCACVRLYG